MGTVGEVALGLEFDERPMVYVAGPYTNPDPVENVRAAINAADLLAADGAVTPHVPHLTHLWHLVSPHPIEFWYAYDLALLRRCDAVLRLPGASTGADAEVAYAHEHDIPVFHDIEELQLWAAAQR